MSVRTFTAGADNKVTDIQFTYHSSVPHNLKISNNLTAINAIKNQEANALKMSSVFFGTNVRTIEDNCCKNCTELTAINFQSDIRTIGQYAFYNCATQGISLPQSVTSIGAFAFASSSRLQQLDLPGSAVAYGQQCFANSGIVSISINTRSGSGNQLFSGCTSLDSASFTGELSYRDFCNCSSLKSISINSSLQIPEECFSGCTSLNSVAFSSNLRNIKQKAFFNCRGISTLDLTNTQLVELGANCFNGTSLKILKLPTAFNSLSFLNSASFSGTDLTEVHFKGISDAFIKDNRDSFNRFGCGHNFLIYSSSGKKYQLNDNGIGIKRAAVYVLSVGHTGGNLTGMWNDIKKFSEDIEKVYVNKDDEIVWHKLGDGGQATESASPANVRKYLNEAVELQPSLFLFHFSDHGGSGGYICLTGGNINNTELFSYFNRLPKTFAIFCCCYPWKGVASSAAAPKALMTAKSAPMSISQFEEDYSDLGIGDQFLKYMEKEKEKKKQQKKLLKATAVAASASDPQVLIWAAGEKNQTTYMRLGMGHFFMEAVYSTFKTSNSWSQQWEDNKKSSFWRYRCEGHEVIPQKTNYNRFDESMQVYTG